MVSVAERARVLALALALAVTAAPLAARAQTTGAAEMLFEEGRRLLESRDVAAACAKFAESQRLEPAGGTLMNLAACHERAGKTATAWAEFNDALAEARRDGRQDRVREAGIRIAALAPRLARVTVTSRPEASPGVTVLLDGVALGAASLGTPIPVDPGEHSLRADAPGRLSWIAHVTIEEGATPSFDVPFLELAPASASSPTAAALAPPPSPAGHPLRVPAVVIGGVGLAALGVGAAFGIVAAEKKHDSEGLCDPSGDACSSTGAGLLRQANTAAWASDFGVGLGAAGLVAATYLFLVTSRRAEAGRVRVVPAVGVESIGLAARGVF
jgi:hypothetical protein